MTELLQIGTLPVAVTLLAYWVGLLCKKKLKLSVISPILVAAVLVLLFLWATKMPIAQYRQGMNLISWLMTPATVCLAIPMYEHFQVLRRNIWAILVSVAAGCIACMGMILGFGLIFGFEAPLTVSLLPKSVTTAIGLPLSELSGGMSSVTTAAIVLTGNLAAIIGPLLCRLFRLTDPMAMGVAYGTAGHVIGTTKAAESGDLAAASGSLSLVIAGILTALVFPLVVRLLG